MGDLIRPEDIDVLGDKAFQHTSTPSNPRAATGGGLPGDVRQRGRHQPVSGLGRRRRPSPSAPRHPSAGPAQDVGCGTILMYGRGAFQPSG